MNVTDLSWRVAFAADGKRFAAGAGSTVRIWDTSTAKPLFALPPLSRPVQALAFSPDDRWVAVAAADVIQRFDASDGQPAKSRDSSRGWDPFT